MKTMRLCGALTTIALFTAACAGNRVARRGQEGGPGAPGGAGSTAASLANAPEPDARELSARSVPELKIIHFAYDSDRLDDEARETLKSNADFLRAHADLKIQVSGDCDQRGTVAYNLALGQRRAAAVRDYYKELGIDPGRVATISYGKERPLCADASEDCWQRNRRAATMELTKPTLAGLPR